VTRRSWVGAHDEEQEKWYSSGKSRNRNRPSLGHSHLNANLDPGPDSGLFVVELPVL